MRAGAAALLAALLLGGCDLDRLEAERVVRAYDEASIHAYRTRDFGPLQDVATHEEWNRVVVLVDLKSANQLVLESELLALAVTDVQRPNPQRLQVGTRERWRYYDRPLQVGQEPGPTFVVETSLAYDFVAEEGRWKLDHARTLDTTYLEPPGFHPTP